MIVAIHQPNYIPWLGYFYKMAFCDVFVLLDNVRHSKSSVTHRNKIKTANGVQLLSVPLKNKESLINELEINNAAQNLAKHWRILENNYKKSQHFNFIGEELQAIYERRFNKLVDLNIEIIKLIHNKLNLNSKLVIASDLPGIKGEGNERNINICKYFNATTYLSGTGARKYNDETSFIQNNIKLKYSEFVHPTYPQLWGEFESHLSIVDLLFNCGNDSKRILLSDETI